MGKQVKIFQKYEVFFGILAVVVCVLVASYVFAADVQNITSVSYSKSYRAINLDWDYESVDATRTNVFAVYRADNASGLNAHRIGVYDYTVRSCFDNGLIPGKNYNYAVVYAQARTDLDSVNTSNLSWGASQQVPLIGGLDAEGNQQDSPHQSASATTASNATKTCARCHGTHDVAASSKKLLITTQDSTEPNARIAICKSCHTSTSAPEKSFVQQMLSATSGHTIKNAENAQGTLQCLTCHGVHQDSKQGTGALTATSIYKFGSLTENITVDPSAQNIQCISCHNDSATWYTATHVTAYPSAQKHESTQSIDSGYKTYPTSGSFTGASTYASSTKNGHSKIASQDTYAQGDCRFCHSAHPNGAEYDALLTGRGEVRAMKATGGVVSDTEKTSGAYASFCLSCHNGSNEGTAWSTAANIADLVSLPAGSTDASQTAFLASSAGHRVTSQNAEVPSGSSLPCYTCHNPHGSKNNNSFNLNDELGSNLNGDRFTCFSCHTTSDGKITAANGTSYEAYSASTPEVVGLSRSGSDDVAGTATPNKLKLPDLVEAHASTSDMSCLECHNNVHAPAEGGGTGDADGKSCLQCHNANEFPEALKYEFTASGSNEALEWENGYNPHLIPFFSHSMGEDFFPETILQPATQALIPYKMTDPATIQAVPDEKTFEEETRQAAPANATGSIDDHVGPYCAGCHAWHTAEVTGTNGSGQDVPGGEEPVPGSNTGATLRLYYNSTKTSNTDYVHTPGSPKLGGLCLSCHNDYLGDSSVGAPTKGPLNDLNKLDSELFNNCFHNYTVELTRKTGAGGQEYDVTKTYYANCAKCHNDADPIANPLENRNTLDLKVHYVPGRRLLARIGIVADIAAPATGSTADETKMLNYNNKGMCFGCHSRKNEIAGNAGKQYTGKDWYGQQDMNSAPSAALQEEGWTYDSTTGLAKKIYRNTAGTIIGTKTMNNEATFDDMYITSAQPSGYPSGDGEGGTADTSASAALAVGAGMEVSGHQVNKSKTNWGNKGLKPYVVAHTSAIRCSECHNTHATGMGAMGSHSEWPTTQKGRVGVTESAAVGGAVGMQGTYDTIYRDQTTPDLAIATDGTRLITLNDFWSRNNIVDNVKSAMVAWLQTSAGGSYSAADAETQYQKLDFNSITPAMVATATGTSVSEGLALEWSRSVDIFCFRCHEESSLAGKAHAGGGSQSHKKGALACVDCHIPTVHGGKIAGLLTDRGAIEGLDGGVYTGHTKMQEHQIFRWTEYKHHNGTQIINTSKTVTSQNTPKAMMYSIDPARSYTNRRTCSVSSNCHNQGTRSESTSLQNWSGAD